MLTLWDILEPLKKAIRRPPRRAGPARQPATPSMQSRYDAIVRDMLHRYRIRVRKWRTSSSGMAWEVLYRDGTRTRLIEAPRPKGPMSMAIFLHEVGHHAIGLGAFKPRCLEEHHAWQFALRAMEEHNLNITDAVRRRVHRSMKYAVAKAQRRGIKSLPQELMEFAR